MVYKRRWRLIDIPGFYSFENANEALSMHCKQTEKPYYSFRIVWNSEDEPLPMFVDSVYFSKADKTAYMNHGI
jgi:hypothetical protein